MRNDDDGTGPSTNGSPAGTLLFNEATILSRENLQAIGNEVITTIKETGLIALDKTGPDPNVVASEEVFTWTIEYHNNTSGSNDTMFVTDILPAGIEFISATHEWNALALSNGAPVNNNGFAAPVQVTSNVNGTTELHFPIAPEYRGGAVFSEEGGIITIQARAINAESGALFQNIAFGCASNSLGGDCVSDTHTVIVENPDLAMFKVANIQEPANGDTVTFTLTLSNQGLHEAPNTVITDMLPAGLTYVTNSTLILTPGWSLGEPSVSGGQLTWSDLQEGTNAVGLVPGLSGSIRWRYQATVSGPIDTLLTNIVCATNALTEDPNFANCAEEEIRIPPPDPSVEKTGPDIRNGGESVSWSILYRNEKREPAQEVYLIDTLPDWDNDGQVDVLFQNTSAEDPDDDAVIWYHAGPSSPVPAFNFAAPHDGRLDQ